MTPASSSVEPGRSEELRPLLELAADRSGTMLSRAVTSAREHLGMDVAYIAAMDDVEQVYVKLAGNLPVGVHEGMVFPREQTLCARVLDGAAPAVIQSTAAERGVSDLGAVQAGYVGSYIGVPITLSDGSTYGTFCCMSQDERPELDDRDLNFLRVIARMIADYLEREQLLAEQAQSRNEMLARVTHDLRNPLQAILGYGSLLVTEHDPVYAQTIVSEATRLNQLLTELLDSDAASLRPPAPFNLTAIVSEQVALFAGQSDAHRLELEAADPVVALGFGARTTSVVANLISNAIKYSPAGGMITLTVEEAGRNARFAVTDVGLGIPEKQAAGIFTRFFRVDTPGMSSIGGTGLGLALSRDVIHAQGGTIGFSSVEGRGSTFWFELPLAAERRATPPAG